MNESVEIFLKLSKKTVQVHLIIWTTLQDAGKSGSIPQRPTIDTESDGPACTRTRLAQSLDSESKPTRLPSSRFSRCHKHPAMIGPFGSHLIILQHNCLFAVAIAYISKCVCK